VGRQVRKRRGEFHELDDEGIPLLLPKLVWTKEWLGKGMELYLEGYSLALPFLCPAGKQERR
jgi:hypothetical protein